MANMLEEDLTHILDNTRELWDEIRGKRIFITGGTGFFGCWLLESFLRANEELGLNASVTVLTRNFKHFRKRAPHLAEHPAIRFHIGDVRTFNFPGESFSHIIHASNEAAESLGRKDAPFEVKNTIIQAARHILDFARHCGAETILFTSSGTVYGPQPSDLSHLPETYQGFRDISQFRFAHGEGKYIAECLCADYAEKHGVEAKIARCFTFVGPYMPLDATYAIGNFIGNVLKNEPVLVKGDGTPYRSYLYAADLTIWLWTILIRGISGRPYNVGSAQERSIAEVARTVAYFLKNREKVQILEKTSSTTPAERYVPSVRRAQRELNLKQNIGLKDAIGKTISWFLKRTE
jgi:nucleoside-diphosphate-sugar epimerase